MALTAERLGAAVTPSPAFLGATLSAGAVVLFAAADGGIAPTAWRAGTVALAGAAALLALRPTTRRVRANLSFAVPLCGYAALSLISALWSADPSASILDAQRTLLYIAGLAAFLLAGEGLAAGVVVGSVVVGAWALVVRAVDGAPLDSYEGRLLTRPIGYANGLGALMAVGAAVSLALALRARRPLFAAPLAVLVPALALTNSRGSELALAVGCLVAVALSAKRRAVAVLLVAGSATLLAWLLVLPPTGIGDRAAYWSAARATTGAHPLDGTGAGTFGRVHLLAPYARDAHSLYLQVLSELGVGGFVLILAFLAIPLSLAIRRNLAAPAAGLTVFVLHAGIDWDWQIPAVTFSALALVAASVAHRSHAGGLEPSHSGRNET